MEASLKQYIIFLIKIGENIWKKNNVSLPISVVT